MEQEKIKNLIRTWREKSHNEGDPFSSFVFIWFCFNAWLEHVSSQETDATMINELTQRSNHVVSLTEAYDRAFQSSDVFQRGVRSLVAKSHEQPILDMRNRRAPILIQDENDYGNIVWAIYRIRCNLFHGGKDANEMRDQALVKNAAGILREWIGELVTDWE